MSSARVAVSRDGLCLTVDVPIDVDDDPDCSGEVILVEEDEVGSDVSKWSVGDFVELTAREREEARAEFYEWLRGWKRTGGDL